MKNSTEKEKILKLLRSSLLNRDKQIAIAEVNEDIFTPYNSIPVEVFAEKLSVGGGKFVYCPNEKGLFTNFKSLSDYREWTDIGAYSKNLQNYLKANSIETLPADNDTKVGVSLCQGIVANTGSIILTSAQGIGKSLVHFPQIMIIIATINQIYTSYKQILNLMPDTLPEWVVSIKANKLIEEEIKELYVFVVGR